MVESQHLPIATHIGQVHGELVFESYFDPDRKEVMVLCEPFFDSRFFSHTSFIHNFKRNFVPKLQEFFPHDYIFQNGQASSSVRRFLAMTLHAFCRFFCGFCPSNHFDSSASGQGMRLLRDKIKQHTDRMGTSDIMNKNAFLMGPLPSHGSCAFHFLNDFFCPNQNSHVF